MMREDHAVEQLPIEQHVVIGDRRSAALIAADGAIVWYCLPHYAGLPVFGAILDDQRGGFWRMGPASSVPGLQQYEPDSATLVTTWTLPGGTLRLTDTMAWPWDQRSRDEGGANGRVILRRLHCTEGVVSVSCDYQPRNGFAAPSPLQPAPAGLSTRFEGQSLTLWSSRELKSTQNGACFQAELAAGHEIWCVLAWGEEVPRPWDVARAASTLAETNAYWRAWLASLTQIPTELPQLRRHALMLKLLTYAPTGSPVAAPTTSLPERIGGSRNWDYRYAWVRDAALCVSVLCQLGDLASGKQYMDCLATYDSATESPLQVVYGVDGTLDLPETRHWDLTGYHASRPVRFGNRACSQRQLDSLGFFVDSALTYLQCGGEWTRDHWTMVQRAADYTVAHWQLPDSGIWELEEMRHYVSSKVMSWVVLDRACRIAERTGEPVDSGSWQRTKDVIHADVLQHGWSRTRQAFTACYEDETLDASALLIPLMGFLPVDHPQVATTVAAITANLVVDGFVYRSRDAIDGPDESREGAFLPCTCWLAMVNSMVGHTAGAHAILDQVSDVAGHLGILSEQVDPATRAFLGNSPLVFSHAEYLRAALMLHGQGASTMQGAVPAGQAH